MLLLTLSFFTVKRQSEAEIKVYQNNLDTYGSSLNRVIENTTSQLTYTTLTNNLFSLFAYIDSPLQQHLYANEIMQFLTVILNQEPMIGGFFLYSGDSSYYFPSFQTNYSYGDRQTIKAFLTKEAENMYNRGNWILLELSDRLVLFQIKGLENSICAAMIDPSLDQAVAAASDPDENILLFYATADGKGIYPKTFLEGWSGTWDKQPIQTASYHGASCRLIKTPINNTEIELCYLVPAKSFWGVLEPSEKEILLLIILLFCSVPFLWMALYKQLLQPLNNLSDTMNHIADGDSDLQVSEDQPIAELQNFSKTLNHMLVNIRQLKLDSYEKKLDLQQAQLQYLHLQIRPHFYINCLNTIYSMAEKKQYDQIREIIISLSDYFRYVFRDSQKLVSLTEELHSTKSYISLQQSNYAYYPTLTMDIEASTAELKILPLSLLTFVENSIKHSHNTTNLAIHIKSHRLHTPKGQYLNLLISDNNGGFSQEDLEYLNHISRYKTLYDDYHVGISNIYYRMELTYHGEGMLFFYNQGDGSCVELIIPITEEETNESVTCG